MQELACFEKTCDIFAPFWIPHFASGRNFGVLWTILTIILFVGLNLASEPIWSSERLHGASPGAVQVEVTAMQFAWYFRYAGPDGKFGSTKPELEDASLGGAGALGLDSNDP